MPKDKQKQSKPRFFQKYLDDGRARADRYMAARPHRSFKQTSRASYKRGKKVAQVWPLLIDAFAVIWREKRTIVVLTIVFALINYAVVGGVSQLTFVDLRQAAGDLFQGNLGALGGVSTLFAAAVTGSLNPTMTPLQQFLSVFIGFLFWLSLVWVLRRRMVGEKTSVREAMYNSGAPIIPSAMVAMTIVMHLIPGVIGIIGAALALTGAWLHPGVESMLVCAAAGLLCLLSVYWAAGSVMALIIVTLPGMYPWKALSAASDLVIGQRWQIIVRMLALGVTIFVMWFAVLIPALLLDGWLKFDWLPLIPIIVQALGAFTLTYCATFMYKMYRSMI